MANPRAEKIAELQARIEAAKAEIAQLKADEQAEKAEVEVGSALNLKDAAGGNQTTAIGLDGERGQDGSLLEAGSGMDLTGQNEGGKTNSLGLPMTREMTVDEKKLFDALVAGDEMTEELQTIANNMTEQDFEDTGIPIVAKSPLGYYDDGEWVSYFPKEDKKGDIAGSSADLGSGETGEHGSGMNISGVEVEEVEDDDASIRDVTDKRPMNIPGIDVDVDDEEMVIEKQIADPEDDKIQGEAAPEKEKDTDGRRKATEIENLRGEKPGWEMAEDANFWSVNEKDPYWKTEEGYEEAVNLYGDKPSWLKAKDVGTLVYNPSTGEYEEVEQEEFVDLSRKVDPKLKKYF